MVRIEKRFVGKRPNTRVALTGAGRRAIEGHWRRLAELREGAMEWSPDAPSMEEG